MDKVVDIKKQILEELENEKYISCVDKNSEIVKILRNASKKDSKLKEEFDNYQEMKRTHDTISDDERFEFAWRVGRTKYNYYASNYGRIIVALNNPVLNNKNEYFLIESNNGYLINNDKYKYFSVTKYTNLYSFVINAFKTSFDNNRNILDKYIKKGIRIEVHHINNQPDDNRIDNLIFLPRTIHSYAHG